MAQAHAQPGHAELGVRVLPLHLAPDPRRIHDEQQPLPLQPHRYITTSVAHDSPADSPMTRVVLSCVCVRPCASAGTVIGTLVTGIVYVEPGADEQLLWVKVPLGTKASPSLATNPNGAW